MTGTGEKHLHILMIGPDRSVHGGISGVVNNYYEAGLAQLVDICYIGTMKEGNKLQKLFTALKALILFTGKLSWCDIVHVNVASDVSYFRKSIFIRMAKFFHKKIVIHQHGGDFEGFYYKQLSEKGRRNVKKVLSMGDAFLVLAPAWKDFFGTIIEKEKITVLPDAIQLPEEISKTYGQHQILFLGRLCKAKGIGELLDVFPELLLQYPDLKLYLAGIWEDTELKKAAEAYPGQIVCPGWITGEEKRKYLCMCDIFVLPSYFEGQSVSLLEAMAYQCACVASRTGGILQMIEEGKTGIFVEPQNAASLKQGLLTVLSDIDLCRQLGSKARQKVEEKFSMDNNISSLLAVYRGVL